METTLKSRHFRQAKKIFEEHATKKLMQDSRNNLIKNPAIGALKKLAEVHSYLKKTFFCRSHTFQSTKTKWRITITTKIYLPVLARCLWKQYSRNSNRLCNKALQRKISGQFRKLLDFFWSFLPFVGWQKTKNIKNWLYDITNHI